MTDRLHQFGKSRQVVPPLRGKIGTAVERPALWIQENRERPAALPGERLAFIMSTENLVSNTNLLALTDVLARLELPLTADELARIARDLSNERRSND